MTLRYLLDTNVISELARRQPSVQVHDRILHQQHLCAIAAPTVEELCFGVTRLPEGKRKQLLGVWLDSILASFIVLSYCDCCARWLGAERARLAKQDISVSRADGEIASIAVKSELVLVTRNTADFQYFTNLDVQNWFP